MALFLREDKAKKYAHAVAAADVPAGHTSSHLAEMDVEDQSESERSSAGSSAFPLEAIIVYPSAPSSGPDLSKLRITLSGAAKAQLRCFAAGDSSHEVFADEHGLDISDDSRRNRDALSSALRQPGERKPKRGQSVHWGDGATEPTTRADNSGISEHDTSANSTESNNPDLRRPRSGGRQRARSGGSAADFEEFLSRGGLPTSPAVRGLPGSNPAFRDVPHDIALGAAGFDPTAGLIADYDLLEAMSGISETSSVGHTTGGKGTHGRGRSRRNSFSGDVNQGGAPVRHHRLDSRGSSFGMGPLFARQRAFSKDSAEGDKGLPGTGSHRRNRLRSNSDTTAGLMAWLSAADQQASELFMQATHSQAPSPAQGHSLHRGRARSMSQDSDGLRGRDLAFDFVPAQPAETGRDIHGPDSIHLSEGGGKGIPRSVPSDREGNGHAGSQGVTASEGGDEVTGHRKVPAKGRRAAKSKGSGKTAAGGGKGGKGGKGLASGKVARHSAVRIVDNDDDDGEGGDEEDDGQGHEDDEEDRGDEGHGDDEGEDDEEEDEDEEEARLLHSRRRAASARASMERRGSHVSFAALPSPYKRDRPRPRQRADSWGSRSGRGGSDSDAPWFAFGHDSDNDDDDFHMAQGLMGFGLSPHTDAVITNDLPPSLRLDGTTPFAEAEEMDRPLSTTSTGHRSRSNSTTNFLHAFFSGPDSERSPQLTGRIAPASRTAPSIREDVQRLRSGRMHSASARPLPGRAVVGGGTTVAVSYAAMMNRAPRQPPSCACVHVRRRRQRVSIQKASTASATSSMADLTRSSTDSATSSYLRVMGPAVRASVNRYSELLDVQQWRAVCGAHDDETDLPCPHYRLSCPIHTVDRTSAAMFQLLDTRQRFLLSANAPVRDQASPSPTGFPRSPSPEDFESHQFPFRLQPADKTQTTTPAHAPLSETAANRHAEGAAPSASEPRTPGEGLMPEPRGQHAAPLQPLPAAAAPSHSATNRDMTGPLPSVPEEKASASASHSPSAANTATGAAAKSTQAVQAGSADAAPRAVQAVDDGPQYSDRRHDDTDAQLQHLSSAPALPHTSNTVDPSSSMSLASPALFASNSAPAEALHGYHESGRSRRSRAGSMEGTHRQRPATGLTHFSLGSIPLSPPTSRHHSIDFMRHDTPGQFTLGGARSRANTGLSFDNFTLDGALSRARGESFASIPTSAGPADELAITGPHSNPGFQRLLTARRILRAQLKRANKHLQQLRWHRSVALADPSSFEWSAANRKLPGRIEPLDLPPLRLKPYLHSLDVLPVPIAIPKGEDGDQDDNPVPDDELMGASSRPHAAQGQSSASTAVATAVEPSQRPATRTRVRSARDSQNPGHGGNALFRWKFTYTSNHVPPPPVVPLPARFSYRSHRAIRGQKLKLWLKLRVEVLPTGPSPRLADGIELPIQTGAGTAALTVVIVGGQSSRADPVVIRTQQWSDWLQSHPEPARPHSASQHLHSDSPMPHAKALDQADAICHELYRKVKQHRKHSLEQEGLPAGRPKRQRQSSVASSTSGGADPGAHGLEASQTWVAMWPAFPMFNTRLGYDNLEEVRGKQGTGPLTGPAAGRDAGAGMVAGMMPSMYLWNSATELQSTQDDFHAGGYSLRNSTRPRPNRYAEMLRTDHEPARTEATGGISGRGRPTGSSAGGGSGNGRRAGAHRSTAASASAQGGSTRTILDDDLDEADASSVPVTEAGQSVETSDAKSRLIKAGFILPAGWTYGEIEEFESLLKRYPPQKWPDSRRRWGKFAEHFRNRTSRQIGSLATAYFAHFGRQ